MNLRLLRRGNDIYESWDCVTIKAARYNKNKHKTFPSLLSTDTHIRIGWNTYVHIYVYATYSCIWNMK